MARVSTYLNFPGTAEEAFSFYKGLFGTDLVGPFVRFSDMPSEGGPELSAEDADKIMHAELEIPGGHVLMATDLLASMGQQCRVGNNTTIFLELDDRADVDAYFAGLSEGGSDQSAPAMMPWGQYWGVVLDRYGIRWMLAAP